VANFRYLGMTPTNRNKFRECAVPFRSETASSHLIFKNIKIYRTKMLPVVLYGCETWSVKGRTQAEGDRG
jgi:hypothetical protein